MSFHSHSEKINVFSTLNLLLAEGRKSFVGHVVERNDIRQDDTTAS